MNENLIKSLEIMWKGCLAIFTVIAIIVVCVLLLTYVDKKINERKAKKVEQIDEANGKPNNNENK